MTDQTFETINDLMGSFKAKFSNILEDKSDDFIFNAFVAHTLYFSKDCEFFTKNINKYLTDGSNDCGIDAIFMNPDRTTNELLVFQNKYYNKTKISEDVVRSNISKAVDNIKAMCDNNIDHFNSRLKYIAKDEIIPNINEDTEISLIFTVSNDVDATLQNKIKKICDTFSEKYGYQISFISGETLISIREQVLCEYAKVPYFEFDILSEDGKFSKCGDTSSGFVDCKSIKRCVETFGNRVFAGNVRLFVKSSSASNQKVDNGIHRTLKDHPERMPAYNNGLNCTAARYEIDNGKLKVWDFSIGNGCQTSTDIKDFDEYLNTVDYPISFKITMVNNDHEYEKCIAIYSNTQKALKKADLQSQDETQLLLKDKIQSEYNIPYITKTGEDKIPGCILSLDAGKYLLSTIAFYPGMAKSSGSSAFSDSIKNDLFCRDRADLIITANHMMKQLSGIEKRLFHRGKKIDNYDISDISTYREKFGYTDISASCLKSGKYDILTCISILNGIYKQKFTFADIDDAISKRTKSSIGSMVELWTNSGSSLDIGIKKSDFDRNKFHEIFEELVSKIVIIISTAMEFYRSNGGNVRTDNFENFFKSDDDFVKYVYPHIKTMYSPLQLKHYFDVLFK